MNSKYFFIFVLTVKLKRTFKANDAALKILVFFLFFSSFFQQLDSLQLTGPPKTKEEADKDG